MQKEIRKLVEIVLINGVQIENTLIMSHIHKYKYAVGKKYKKNLQQEVIHRQGENAGNLSHHLGSNPPLRILHKHEKN